MQTQTIQIPEHEVVMIQDWLDSDEAVPDTGECETIKIYTAEFADEVEVDIKVVNGDTGPYIDAVIFEDGNEIGFLEVGETLLGVYDFREEQDFYRVIVEQIA